MQTCKTCFIKRRRKPPHRGGWVGNSNARTAMPERGRGYCTDLIDVRRQATSPRRVGGGPASPLRGRGYSTVKKAAQTYPDSSTRPSARAIVALLALEGFIVKQVLLKYFKKVSCLLSKNQLFMTILPFNAKMAKSSSLGW